jgi:uncharacterized protein (DUF433 family)
MYDEGKGGIAMQLEDYFDFTDYEQHGEIRIQGHRIWMHNVLEEYLRHGLTTPQQLLDRFPSLDMPIVLACLLYYRTHQAAMDKLLEDYLEYCKRSREEYERTHPEQVERMRNWVIQAMAKQGQSV